MGSPDCHVVPVDIHFPRLLWVCHLYHWRELSLAGTAVSIIFVATNTWQIFVATSILLSGQKTCFVSTKMPSSSQMTEQRDWGEKKPSHVDCVSRDLKCWWAWGNYLRAQGKGCHTIDRRAQRGNAQNSFLKGRERAIANQTNVGIVSNATLGTFLREEVKLMWVLLRA